MTPPVSPDRSHLATEQRHPGTADLHARTPSELVDLFAIASTREVLAALEHAATELAQCITAATPGFLRGGRLIYLGAGTSGRLGVLDASEAPPTFCVPPERVVGIIAGGDSALRRPSEGAEDDPHGAIADLERLAITSDDTVIGIAAGGTTPYVQGALAWAAPRCLACLITCADVPAPAGCRRIWLPTGPEPLTGSTRMKAGTATKLALNTISTALMCLGGKVHGNLMVDVRATNAKLRDRAARIVAQLTGLSRSEALALLPQAGWSAKTAVVMHRHACDAATAEALLIRCAGRLDAALQSTTAAGLPPAPPA
jgi:N-acetylmuramic acid 6-phosphate etherase